MKILVDENEKTGFGRKAYEDLRNCAEVDDKLVAWTEIGLGPSEEVVEKQAHAFFMMWGGFEVQS